MNRTTFAYLISGVLLNAVAQLALKAATNRLGTVSLAFDGLAGTALRVGLQPFIWVGLACYGVSVAVWIAALSRIEVVVLFMGAIVVPVIVWFIAAANAHLPSWNNACRLRAGVITKT